MSVLKYKNKKFANIIFIALELETIKMLSHRVNCQHLFRRNFLLVEKQDMVSIMGVR